MSFIKFINFCVDLFLPKKTPKNIRQFVNYLVCGGFATIADMSVLFILSKVLHINYLVAAPIGFIAGVATNYSMNIRLVFESKGKKKTEFTIFAIIGIGGLLWTEFLLWILVTNLGLYLMIAKAITVILVLFWNFFMRKRFVFATKETSLETLEKSIEEL